MVLPLQTFGIGDIIFTQTLIRGFGEQILWPVEPQFIEGLNRAYPDIFFIDQRIISTDSIEKEEEFIYGMKVIPIRWAHEILNRPYSQVMRAKYDLYNQDHRQWKSKAMWHRDTQKEDQLFQQLECDRPYNLINRFYGSDSNLKADIELNNGIRNIEMSTISGFSLFDWAKVLQHAAQIHSVSTSLFYLFELMNLKCPIHLYTRKPLEPTFENIEYLFTKRYVRHI